MADGNKLILIDGNSIAYRAFFALPLLSTADGKYTNAVYGFTMMLLRLLEDEKPTHILVAFDAGKENFRHEQYAEYKGTRDKTPGELSEQFPLIRDVLNAFGIRYVEQPGYEADDIIGTLTKKAEEEGYDCLVVSGDKDLLQLVSDHVQAMLTRKGITEVERFGIREIHEKYGLTPAQIIDLKGLMGDTSDNIPGIPGVGEKTALKLLHQFGSVENVLDRVDEVSGKKLQERIREHREQALLSKQLATIHRDVPLDLAIDSFAYQGFDTASVKDIFQKLAFKSLLDRLPEEEHEKEEPIHQDFDIRFVDESELESVIASFPPTVGVYLDLEGNYHQGILHGVMVGSDSCAWYIETPDGKIPSPLQSVFLENKYKKVMYDVKAAAYVLRKQGLEMDRNVFDVLLVTYLLNPSEGTPDLIDLLNRELKWGLLPLAKEGKRSQMPSREERVQWMGKVAIALSKVESSLSKELADKELDTLYHELELPLSYVLAQMEFVGIRVDVDRLREMGEEFKQSVERLTKEIYEMAGTEFNINSPKQLGEILFDKMGLPVQKKTKTGYSTSADVLEKLAPFAPIVQKILDYRQLVKLESTYVEGLLKVVRPETWRVHTSFNQALTATGRLSSTDPNLQNIPIRMEEGRRLRQVFIPTKPNWKIVSADYSQIELRILAHISQDENMRDAFIHDLDIHTRTAADVFEVPLDKVTAEMRRAAKAVNFGIVYGISDYGLSQNLNITRKQAAEFIENYFSKFPGVKRFMTEIVEQARKNGYVTTLLNRRRYLPDINSRNFNLRSFAERTAMNTPIQGTAADIIKKAMVDIHREIIERGLTTRMLLQVHDELIFEVPPEELAEVIELVRKRMEEAIELSVPLKVDIHAGNNWYEAK
jgi:DNA polymerase-1